MPRVVPAYKEELRKRILETATRLVLENGYKNVNMGDIAAEAGISRPTVYLYFRDKKELFVAILHSLIEEVGLAAQQALRSGTESSDGGFFDIVTERFGNRFEIFFEVISAAGIDPSLVDDVRGLHETILSQMAAELGTRFAGQKDPPDPYIMANSLLALFIGLQIRKKIGLPPGKARESWALVTDSLFPYRQEVSGNE